MAFQTITSASGNNKPQSDDLGHLGDSWIEMYASDRSGNNSGLNSGTLTPTDRVTPLPFSNGGGEDYLRLLRDAAKESKESSRVVSLAGSRRDSPRSSPKSPPNSPNNELATDDDFKDIFINYYNNIKDAMPATGGNGQRGKGTWDWNSRPDQFPPKVWKLPQSGLMGSKGYSIRLAKVGKNSIFSKEVFYSLIISNMLSLLIGTGIGIWLTKRGLFMATRMVID